MDSDKCTCGHARDEHEQDQGSSACSVEGCNCTAFELDDREEHGGSD